MYFNACSLIPKLDELALLIETYNPDIVCIVETWLDASVSDNEINFAGFSVYHCDRNRHGGGVLLFVKNYMYLGVKILPTQLPDVTTLELEFLVLSLYHSTYELAYPFFTDLPTPLHIYLILFVIH